MDCILKSPGVGFGEGKVTDVFLLGAGFSKAISPRMPTLAGLTAETLKGLQANTGVLLPQFAHSNVELALTYLMTRHPWLSDAEFHRNMAAAYRILDKIRDAIHDAERAVVLEQQECPHWLRQLAHWMHDAQAAVITLNYDTLLERAFAEIPIAGNDVLATTSCLDQRSLLPFDFRVSSEVEPAVPFPTAQLMKLHGSMNWYYSGAADFFGETLRLRPLISWRNVGYVNIKEDEVVPFIVPPLGEKAVFFDHAGMRKQWRSAERAIRTASRFFCIGYSFPETDLAIRFLLSPRLTGPASFYLIDIDRREERVEALRSVLPPSWQVNTDFFGPAWTDRLPKFLLDSEPKQEGRAEHPDENRLARLMQGALTCNQLLSLGPTPSHFRITPVQINFPATLR